MLTDDSTPKILESFHLGPLWFRLLLHEQCCVGTAASKNQKGGKSSLRLPL